MNNDELKDALQNRRPVIAQWPTTGDIEYERVYEIVYGIDEDDNITVSVELLSKCGHSVTRCKPENIRYKHPITL